MLKVWLKEVIENEKKDPGEIQYIFVADNTLLKMNMEFLKHNYYTDIITFDYCENQKVSGDIFISIDRIKENAVKFKVPYEDELHRVMVHGILHLCGYKDKSGKDFQLIRKRENKALAKRQF